MNISLLGSLASTLIPKLSVSVSIIADVAGASDVILNGGVSIAQGVSASWDAVWESVLQGGVYLSLCNVGIMIALICLMMFIVDFAKKWLDSGSGGDWIVAELIIPVFVIMLLTNQGALLAQLSQGMRGIINDVNDQVLANTAANAQFAEILSGLADHSTTKNDIQSIRARCNSLTDNAELQQCLEQGLAKAQQTISEYQSQHGGQMPAWASSLQDYVQKAFSDPLSAIKAVAGGPSSIISNAIVPIGNTALVGLIEIILLAFMTAFQHTIEATMLLTALIAPIPIGASLLPFGAKPMYAWIAGFWSIGMMKLGFNIIVGLIGTVIAEAGPESTGELVIAAVLGVFSPVLAMGLAAGGGMALFQAICSGAQAAASKGVVMFSRL